MMKKLFSLAAFFMLSLAGLAQNVDNFEVGPYEVEYNGSGDYKFRIRKDVDLYEYFNLKKDTVIKVAEFETSPVKQGWQVGLTLNVPRYIANTSNNVIGVGVDGIWKCNIGNKVYFNTGVSASFTFYEDGTMPQIGIPLSIEFSELDYKKASLYCGVGLVPTFFSGVKKDGESKSGLLIAPKLEVGTYIPMVGRLIRLGGFISYPEINCSGGDDVIKERFGRLFVGANICFVF